MRVVVIAFGLLGAVLSALLAYGYWHAGAHGTLYLTASDYRERAAPRPITNTQISLLDGARNELARFVTDERYGVGFVSWPKEYVCDLPQGPGMPQRERLSCLQKQSRWVMTWARQAKYARFAMSECTFSAFPIAVQEYVESWLIWWVPLPHVFGAPTTLFNIYLNVDGRACGPVSLT